MPADSIFVTSFRYKITDSLRTPEDSMQLDALEIFFNVDVKKITALLCWFDKDINKFLALSPSGTSDVEENKRLINFLHRQKNFMNTL